MQSGDSAPNQPTATLLVVDDEPAIREMLITSLGVAGFECLEAADIQDA